MILTQCPVCAAQLPHTSAKQCSRCKTRYCGPECQKQHWEGGGHDQLCKKIKKAGGAEQYNANSRYAEAVSVAVEACADDTKGQTCYICTQALHWKTKEGLVRMCACRGTAGFAHVSCLAEQAKILYNEAEENNLGVETKNERWARWYACGLCKQQYHGVVWCALGWACWKTYVGRPEADWARGSAMNLLGNGLAYAEQFKDAVLVYEADLAMLRRLGGSADSILGVQSNLANTYRALGRDEQALELKRDVYSGRLQLNGVEHENTLIAANNYAAMLKDLKHFEEAKFLLRKIIPVARRVVGDNDEATLRMKWNYAMALCNDTGATLDDLREAVTTLEDAGRIGRRVLGGAHPLAVDIVRDLQYARAALGARDVEPLRDAVGAMGV